MKRESKDEIHLHFKRLRLSEFCLFSGCEAPGKNVQAGPSSPCHSGRSELQTSTFRAVTHRFLFFKIVHCFTWLLHFCSLSLQIVHQIQRHWFCISFCVQGVYKLEKGSVTLGMVTNIQPQLGLLVKLPFGNSGTVAVTDLADAYRPNPLGGYSKDQLLRSGAVWAQLDF